MTVKSVLNRNKKKKLFRWLTVATHFLTNKRELTCSFSSAADHLQELKQTLTW